MSSWNLRIFLGFNFDLPADVEGAYTEEEYLKRYLEARKEKKVKVAKILQSSEVAAMVRKSEDDDTSIVFVQTQGQAWEVLNAFNRNWSEEIGIASPPLPITPATFKPIRNICAALKAGVNADFGDEFISRVHISKKGSFGNQLIKKLGAFVWNFESVLDKFHAPRFAEPDYRTNFERGGFRDNGSLYYDHISEREVKGDPMSSNEALQCILDCKTGNEVINLVMHPNIWGSQKYSLSSLSTPLSWFDGAPGMMFEQHEATFEYDRIESWTRVRVSIVDFLHKSKPSAVVGLLQRHIDGAKYSPEKLLADIGLADLIDFYQPQFEEYDLNYFQSF